MQFHEGILYLQKLKIHLTRFDPKISDEFSKFFENMYKILDEIAPFRNAVNFRTKSKELDWILKTTVFLKYSISSKDFVPLKVQDWILKFTVGPIEPKSRDP